MYPFINPPDRLVQKNIKAVFIVAHADFGYRWGHCGRMLRLASGWKSLGNETVLFSFDKVENRSARSQRIDLPEIYAIDTKDWFDYQLIEPRITYKLRRYLIESSPDIVFALGMEVNLLTKFALINTDLPLVTMLTGNRHFQWNSMLRKWLHYLLQGTSDAYVANFSESLQSFRKAVRRKYSNTAAHTVIPNPVIADEFERKPCTGESDQFIIGALGRFVNNKGFKYLLMAFCELMDRHGNHDLLLKLKGEGPSKKWYQAIVKKNGIHENVLFEPPSPGVESFYHSLDLFVNPTQIPKFDNTLLEAINAGVLTLGTPESGLRFFEGFRNWTFKAKDKKAIYNQIMKILDWDPEKKNRVLRKQWECVENNFEASLIAKRLDNFLHDQNVIKD